MPLACSQACWTSWSAAGRTCTEDRVLMDSEACTDETTAVPAIRAMAMAMVLAFMTGPV
ncbi:hypothetical protein D3C73_1115950 [compost metagenome]